MTHYTHRIEAVDASGVAHATWSHEGEPSRDRARNYATIADKLWRTRTVCVRVYLLDGEQLIAQYAHGTARYTLDDM